MARTKARPVPEVGAEAPEVSLPSAQGGQLRLSVRAARGPVVLVFYGGAWSEEDVAYVRGLASKEDEINLAGASVVGVGVGEPQEARDFVRETGVKSYVLYDYAGVATRDYGLLAKDREHGEHARPATFVVGGDMKVVHAWVDERPGPGEVLAKVSEITGLPKEEPAGEEEAGGERPERAARDGAEAGTDAGPGAGGAEERKKLSPEERERRRAERRAARDRKAAGGE